jgi:hypothetical protein
MLPVVAVLPALLTCIAVSFATPIEAGGTHSESHGVKFVLRGTLLSAEEYEETNLLLPFPAGGLELPKNIYHVLDSLRLAFMERNCTNTVPVIANDSHAFDLLNLVLGEMSEAEEDLLSLKQTISQVLFEKPGTVEQSAGEALDLIDDDPGEVSSEDSPGEGRPRPRRSAAFIVGAAGVAAGALAAPEIRCFLRSILGPCDSDKIRRNQAMISKTYSSLKVLRADWLSGKAELNGKFFVLGQHLTKLAEVQESLSRAQEEQWNETQKIMDVLGGAIEKLEKCMHFMFRRTTVNHVRSGVLSLLSAQMGQVMQYRTVLYTFKTNLLNSVVPLGRGELPLSLVPVQQLQAILKGILIARAGSSTLGLAIPLEDTHLYYSLDLVRHVTVGREGIVIGLAIPFSSGSSMLKVHQAISLPMIDGGEEAATVWDIESPYIAVVEGRTDHALISAGAFAQCRGTQALMVCPDSFALYSSPISCVAALYLRMDEQVLKLCGILKYDLPSPERATDLGDGQWLLESKVPTFSGNILAKDKKVFSGVLADCRVCLVTLMCGSVLQTLTMRIPANAHTCVTNAARVTEVRLAIPLQKFFKVIPGLDKDAVMELPKYRSELLSRFQMKVRTFDHPKLDEEAIRRIARPLSDTMTSPEPEEFWGSEISYWKPSLVIGSLSLLVNFGLQSLGAWIVARHARLGLGALSTTFHDLVSGRNAPPPPPVPKVHYSPLQGVTLLPSEMNSQIIERLSRKLRPPAPL